MRAIIFFSIIFYFFKPTPCAAQVNYIETEEGKWHKKELFEHLDNLKDSVFIYPRKKLIALKSRFITGKPLQTSGNDLTQGDKVIIKGIGRKNQYKVIMRIRPFNSKGHDLTKLSENKIDGRKAWGVDGSIPDTELYDFKIQINNSMINIPISQVSNLYNVNLNTNSIDASFQTIEVCESPSGKYLYIYLNGSDAAGYYSAKLIVGTKGFVTKIVTLLCGYDFLDLIQNDCV